MQQNTVDERYGKPRDTCYLWPMIQVFDDEGKPTGRGYNDWGMGWFEPRKDCVMDQYHASKADTMREIGKAYVEEVIEGNFGAYCIANHPTYPYYVVEWIVVPWEVKKSEVLFIGREKNTVHKGDWLCRGVWMEKLDGAQNWHTTTVNLQECIVQLKTVLHANLELRYE